MKINGRKNAQRGRYFSCDFRRLIQYKEFRVGCFPCPFRIIDLLSKHDPNFEQKRFEYIAEMGLDPVTGKEADEELLNYATNYTRYAPSIKAGYDFLMVSAAAWSTRAYNKDLQSQRANAKVNE